MGEDVKSRVSNINTYKGACMNSKLQLVLLPIIIILVLGLMMAGYNFTLGFKGPANCLDALEDEIPGLLTNYAKTESMNTRIVDDHWISAIVFRDRELEEYEEGYEVTFVCHFAGETHSYNWSKKFLGNEIDNLELNSTSLIKAAIR